MTPRERRQRARDVTRGRLLALLRGADAALTGAIVALAPFVARRDPVALRVVQLLSAEIGRRAAVAQVRAAQRTLRALHAPQWLLAAAEVSRVVRS